MAKNVTPPRLLIEEWLPAAAIGVECMREELNPIAKPPTKYYHVWWARRPLCASRAAVLASLLPGDFPRQIFERLLGFGRGGAELVEIRRRMDAGERVEDGFGCDRAFKADIHEEDLEKAHAATARLWGQEITVMDPMAGGGSIPLESARLGFHTLANEYNPVACSILEATVDYPFRFGDKLGRKARHWAKVWSERVEERLAKFYPEYRFAKVHAYIFARTVPCPDTKHKTPLVPDWHLLRTKGEHGNIVANPIVDEKKGTWKVEIRELGKGAGRLQEVPPPTCGGGKGISLFTGRQIPAEYIKAMAQSGKMGSALYAVALKTPQGLKFQPPEPPDLKALTEAEKELARLRPDWEKTTVIPTEKIPLGDKTGEALNRGIDDWADMFSPRQLLCLGVMVEELRNLRTEIVKAEEEDVGEAVIHLLALVLDKLADYNAILTMWHAGRGVVARVFEKHDYAFSSTFAEIAPCTAGSGLEWVAGNVLKAYGELSAFAHSANAAAVTITAGSATALPQMTDGSITAVVVDPPYADNVQYSELADFFYVWLKRTQGHRRPEWFSTYLCEHDQEAVVNVSRFKTGEKRTGQARTEAHEFYQKLMTDTFRECRRILRDDGVLTVMFTHKKQEAWEALFQSLISAGFTTTATWPIKTESQHSLHQARKNAAQSTVILVARKRAPKAGVGYFDSRMQQEIRGKARAAAERLRNEGLNAVDQLVGSFGPAMEVYSRYDEVRTDTGQPVGVDKAIDEASEAVSAWRVEQLAAKGLEGVEPEGCFCLLCWDVLGAAEFRFNEAHLLGKAVGMDVDQLVVAGLVTKSGDKIRMVPAKDRRRERALEPDEIVQTLFGTTTKEKKRTKKQILKVHPNDPQFRTALDACHALALRYVEAGAGSGGIGSAKALVRQQGWKKDSSVAKLMEALVHAAPEALRFDTGKKSVAAQFPEFRAWHALMEPLFDVSPPKWVQKKPTRTLYSRIEEREDESEAQEGGEEAES